MTDPILKRLRGLARGKHDDLSVADEAADTIEGLQEAMKGARIVAGYAKGALAEVDALKEDVARLTKERDEARAEIERLRESLVHEKAERDLLQDVIDSRPPINAGLPETYIRWSGAIYSGDFARTMLESGND